VDKLTLKTKIKNLVKENLSSYEFVLIKPRIIERKLTDFYQGLEFQPGTNSLGGKFTLNIYWRFDYIKRDYIAFDGNKRIGELAGQGDLWFSSLNEDIEISFAAVTKLIKDIVVPRFEKFNSIEKIVSAYEVGEISKKDAFGADIGWQAFNLGCSYLKIGKNDSARKELQEVIDKYSTRNIEWVQNRKNLIENLLETITNR
jgi:hypothetical protein